MISECIWHDFEQVISNGGWLFNENGPRWTNIRVYFAHFWITYLTVQRLWNRCCFVLCYCTVVYWKKENKNQSEICKISFIHFLIKKDLFIQITWVVLQLVVKPFFMWNNNTGSIQSECIIASYMWSSYSLNKNKKRVKMANSNASGWTFLKQFSFNTIKYYGFTHG